MSKWLIVGEPLAVPLISAAVGAFAAHVISRRYHLSLERQRSTVVAALLIVAIIAAWTPNAGQFLYERGLPLPAFEYVQAASYFPFAFSIVAIWKLLSKKWQRGLLMLLVPVSFAQPLLWTWAYFSWTVWGFAP